MRLRNVLFFWLPLSVLMAAVALYNSLPKPEFPGNIEQSSVLVTTISGDRGGSGTILRSTQFASYILTNAHVCNGVQNGKITTEEGRVYFISSYTVAENHDLCLVTVQANLGIQTSLSHRFPDRGTKAHIVGHPHLFPTVVSNGYFFGRQLYSIYEGLRCVDPTNIFTCMPVITVRDGEVISALISPGSSGSGVFDDAGDLSAVAFAGQGDLAYAIVVPLEYIYDFLRTQGSVASLTW